MKTLLISISYGDRLSNENLGLERIYTYLKEQKKDVDILYLNKTDDIKKEFSKIDLSHKIFAFSVLQDNIDFDCTLSLLIKRSHPASLIVFGSKYVTSYYKDIALYEKDKKEPCFDLLVLGDGEYTILNIINCLEKGENIDDFANKNENIATIKSTENKTPLPININELPIPERIYIKNNNSIIAYICDSHGCLGRCSFCCSYFHHKWCGRSAESLFHEVLTIYNNTKARIFVFTGSSFEDPGNMGKERISKFCDMVIESKLLVSFRCYLRAETFTENKSDIELLRKMKMAGFSQVYVGIESGNDEDLQLYCKKATLNDNKKILMLLNKIGIFCGAYGFIMFNPYSNLRKISDNYYYLADNQPFNLNSFTTKLIVYKGTKIHDILRKENLIINKNQLTYNMIEDYYFVDKEIGELYAFVKYICTDDLTDVMANTSFVTSLLHSFDYFPDINESIAELSNIISFYETVIREYFYWLYVKYDISFCEKTYDEFKYNILNNDKKMQLLKNRFLRKMMKCNIFLS